MRRLALALAALAALAAPASALAHATLAEAVPAVAHRYERAPRQVAMRFSATVEVLKDSIVVLDGNGRVVSGPPRQTGPLTAVAPLRRLVKGPYTLRWRILSSADGHVTAGVYTFGVRYPAPPATAAYGTGGPTPLEHVVRWLTFLSLALLAGGLVARLLLVPGTAPAQVERRLARLTGLGAVGVLECGIVAFLLRADGVLQVPFSEFVYGDLSPLANETRYGSAFIVMTLGFVAVATLLFLAWLLDQPVLLWPALALTLAFGAGLSLSGHASEGPHAKLAQLADWVHLSAASIWVGGLLALVTCVWPLAPEARRDAFLRFSRLATVLVAALLAAGVYLAIVRLPEAHDLWRAGYGRILLVKLGLVALALAWGGFHHLVVRPVLERGGRDRFVGRVGRSLVGEGTVAMAVLLVAAILVGSSPPPQGGAGEAQQAAVAR